MRKIALLVLTLGLLAAGVAWWTGRQGGQLPGWYLEAQAAGRLEPDLEAAARSAQQSLVGRFGRELLDEVTADDGTPNESFSRPDQAPRPAGPRGAARGARGAAGRAGPGRA